MDGPVGEIHVEDRWAVITGTIPDGRSMINEESIQELAQLLRNEDGIDTSPEVISAHSYDCWPLAVKWRLQDKMPFSPEVVVYPSSTEEVATVLSWANERQVAITAWGLGSSVVGGPIPTKRGICLDLSRMNATLGLNEEDMTVRVQAGAKGGGLEKFLNEKGLTLNNSPQSLYRSSVGGWVATRETGQFSSRYGGIEDLCVGLIAVLADGTVIDTGTLPRMAVGPDLRQIMIGSEGCLSVITEVEMRVFRLPEDRELETVTFPSVVDGIAAIREIMQSDLRPFLLRFYDPEEAHHAMVDKAFASPVMFLGCQGRKDIAGLELDACIEICKSFGGETIGSAGVEAWLDRRFDFSAVEAVLDRPGGVAETIEVAHCWSGINETYLALKERLAPFADEVLGHFSHAYSNGVSLYIILIGETDSAAAAEQRLHDIWRVSMEVAIETGAAISHHHGTGMARAPYVQQALGSAAPILSKLKDALDPKGILNPGKLGLGV